MPKCDPTTDSVVAYLGTKHTCEISLTIFAMTVSREQTSRMLSRLISSEKLDSAPGTGPIKILQRIFYATQFSSI